MTEKAVSLPRLFAAAKGDVSKYMYVHNNKNIDESADVSLRQSLNSILHDDALITCDRATVVWQNGVTALMLAARAGHAAMCSQLIELGANVKARSGESKHSS